MSANRFTESEKPSRNCKAGMHISAAVGKPQMMDAPQNLYSGKAML
jgi:hypothetical protein